MKAPYNTFDLPRIHLAGGQHFVPPKARDSTEIERRHSMPAGTILLEHQQVGAQIAEHMIGAAPPEGDDLAFTNEVVVSALLNSDWYQSARDAPVMRRRRDLPFYGLPADMYRPLTWQRRTLAYRSLGKVASVAEKLATLRRERKVGQVGQGRLLGSIMTATALEIACAPLADETQETAPFTTQVLVRNRSLEALERARTLGLEIGTPPSLAQLADPQSDLSVHIMRNAPNAAFEAFQEASTLFALPR